MCAFAYIQLQCTQVQTKTDGEYVIFSRKEKPFGLTSTWWKIKKKGLKNDAMTMSYGT